MEQSTAMVMRVGAGAPSGASIGHVLSDRLAELRAAMKNIDAHAKAGLDLACTDHQCHALLATHPLPLAVDPPPWTSVANANTLIDTGILAYEDTWVKMGLASVDTDQRSMAICVTPHLPP